MLIHFLKFYYNVFVIGLYIKIIRSNIQYLLNVCVSSMLLDMRCQIHAELAAIEEEAERLEPAAQHLQAALVLDESGQFQQRLSFSLHLIQLRSNLYKTPTRNEDQAAMLIQQV